MNRPIDRPASYIIRNIEKPLNHILLLHLYKLICYPILYIFGVNHKINFIFIRYAMYIIYVYDIRQESNFTVFG